MKITGKITLGVLLIAIGVLFLGSSLLWWDLRAVNGWWALFIIVPSLVAMVNDGIRTSNSIFLLIGVALFLRANRVFDFDLWYVVIAAILIIAGVSVITGGFGRQKKFEGTSNQYQQKSGECDRDRGCCGSYSTAYEDRSDRTDITSIFNSINNVTVSENYQGGHVVTVFGKTDLDLRHAKINHDISLTVESVFGSTNVILPENIRVGVAGTPILGNISNRMGRVVSPDAPMIHFDCTAAFGNIEIL